jgi:hypothetical protein
MNAIVHVERIKVISLTAGAQRILSDRKLL